MPRKLEIILEYKIGNPIYIYIQMLHYIPEVPFKVVFVAGLMMSFSNIFFNTVATMSDDTKFVG